ncbi:MAG: twin-arginine translocase subunit TatC [Arsenophonus sp. NC-CH8-MAG3]
MAFNTIYVGPLSSGVLFTYGFFSYFFVFPLAISFVKTTKKSLNIIKILVYILVYHNTFIAFSAIFEVPVSSILLCLTVVVMLNYLKHKRRYIIVGFLL